MNTCRHTRFKTVRAHVEGHRKATNQPFRYQVFRRRECLDCGERFNTYELTESQICQLIAVGMHGR